MQENPMVENGMPGAGPDDTVLEAADQSQREETTLDAFMEEDNGPQESQPPEQEKGEKPGGWIQRRIQEGVQKGLQQALTHERARISAEYDAKLKPLKEAMLQREAEDLVRSGKVQSREIALEYLRLKSGLAPETPLTQQPTRNERGQFVSQAQAQETERYGGMLIAQVKAIEAATGLNVMDAYNQDTQIVADATSVTTLIGTIKGNITDIETSVGALNDFKNEQVTYIRQDSDGVHVGKNSYQAETLVASDGLHIKDNKGAECAYFTDSKSFIKNAQITDTLQVGGFQYIRFGTGRMSIKWVG